MARVLLDISMSLDGFVTGPDADLERGLGRGGEPIHEWAIGGSHEADREVIAASLDRTGAVVMGRKTFDFIDGPNGWGDELDFGGERGETAPPPIFVVTHSAPDSVRLSRRTIVVTDGIASAIERAKAAAGDKDVTVMGGGSLIRQCVEAGIGDELRIHLAPVLMWQGTRLFEPADSAPTRLERMKVLDSPSATHLYYRLTGDVS